MENPYNDLEPTAVKQLRGSGWIDFNWAVTYFDRHGKEKFGPNFRIYEEDHDLLYTLMVYFMKNEKEARRLGLDLKKGLLVSGPIGCGKSKLMRLLADVHYQERLFTIKPCRDVAFELFSDGFEVIDRYSRMSYTNGGPKHYCFDDLGTEASLKYYGNTCNVMAEIIMNRYDHFFLSGMVTHITTNLSSTEIEEMYGSRVRSRMREMFNLIAFPETSKDKRR